MTKPAILGSMGKFETYEVPITRCWPRFSITNINVRKMSAEISFFLFIYLSFFNHFSDNVTSGRGNVQPYWCELHQNNLICLP